MELARYISSFRPLTGIMVLNDDAKLAYTEMYGEFPSPYGDYGSKLDSGNWEILAQSGSFRPLTGIMVLNSHTTISRKHMPNIQGFRPLTGIMVLNSTPYRWLRYAIEKAICGADFMFRLFSGFSLKFAFKNPQRPPFHHIGAKWYKTYEICLYYIILLKFFVEYQKYFLTPLLKAWP